MLRRWCHLLFRVMVILFRVLVTLHGVLNSPYTGNSSELWLLFIFNSVYKKKDWQHAKEQVKSHKN